ncbi:MAG: tetratricopeptide repeat protein [Gemmatimonadaceae bacterium]|nr:tetratricopeptide repeat protein [Gemmatimonadaceae bacterium]
MSRTRHLPKLLPAVLLAAGGCLATRSDVERLELSLRAMRDSARIQQARSDSTTRLLLRDATLQLGQQFSRSFAALSDSVRRVAAGVAGIERVQGDLSLSMHDFRAQIAAVQEGVGISQKRLADLRSSVEAAAASAPAAVAPPAVPAGTGGAAAPTVGQPAAPPAAILWESGTASLTKGATAAARESFQALVTNYPTYERVPEAQMYIADAYAQEGNRTAADSVYALAVATYPAATEVAARSLFKRAKLAVETGNPDRAKALYQQIIDKYPGSTLRELAGVELKGLGRP